MIIAEFSIAVSFVIFLIIFIRKVWPLIISGLDSYIKQEKDKIDTAAKLKSDAEKNLKLANKHRSETEIEIDKYREESKTRLAQLEESNALYLKEFKKKSEEQLKSQLKSETEKQRGILISQMADLITERLSKNIQEVEAEISVDDLKKLI